MENVQNCSNIEDSQILKRNFRNVQIDAIAIGLTNAASPFLPVFLSRLNASTFEISLLTTMPGITGLFLVLPIGQFLQSRKNIVPWFSAARLFYILSYALTGLAAFLLKDRHLIIGILAIWGLATFPQILLNITFPVVMNAVAGPNRRYELMSRRWSILGITTSIAVFSIGQILERISFPFNYQAVFLGLSASGFLSYFISRQIVIPDTHHSNSLLNQKNMVQIFSAVWHLVTSYKPFTSFILRRFVYLVGFSMTLPLFPIYYVKVVHAPDPWIATFATVQTSFVVVGYLFWSKKSLSWGPRNTLLLATLCLSLFPIAISQVSDFWLISILTGISGIFQGGLDLVLFDELMKTIPLEYSATFVSVSQGMQYASSILGPIIGTLVTNLFGIAAGLITGGVFIASGFLLFLFENKFHKHSSYYLM